jgi:hypothetical protein
MISFRISFAQLKCLVPRMLGSEANAFLNYRIEMDVEGITPE